MKAVVAYCRSGYEPQGAPSNVGRQARAIRRYAKRHGLNIREVYIDPGVSGITMNRPEQMALRPSSFRYEYRMIRQVHGTTRDISRLLREFDKSPSVAHMQHILGVAFRIRTRANARY